MGRGPSYPFVDLEEAISLTRKIYEYARKSAAPTDAVVEHALGYSLKSSSGVKIVAALKAFGLAEELDGNNGKTIKITDRAYRILIDDQDSAERLQAIKDAALAPKWYQYCWEKWGSSAPPSMRSTLLIDHGFVPSTVDSFLKDYKKTLEYACIGTEESSLSGKSKDGDQKLSHSFKVGDNVQWESQGVLRMPSAKKISNFSEDGTFAFVEGSPTGIPIGQLISAESPEPQKALDVKPLLNSGSVADQLGVRMQVETITLADGITLQLQWPSTITQDSCEDFIYQLEGFRKKVYRAVQKTAEDKKAAGES
jgi:hypothetical protein